jgi:cell division protein FtsB
MSASAAPRANRRRLHVDRAQLKHPVRQLFGESRGVTVGVMIIMALVGLMLVRPLAHTFFSWHRTAGILQERRVEVRDLRARNTELNEQVKFFDTPQFVSEQARSYGMVMPGEKAFVIRELVHPESAAQYAISRLRNVTVDDPTALAAG